ncbi:helix-turn-helix domain-containing protein [Tsukamurella tyrosinosolvens]|uniref:helix-turn-helix domain-containing protein n=1 Tax=Tsukamurella tyrosinosolvens TaxID=57704 RepID=UPI001CE0FE6C|nr:helix-turn-helix domain-containing protein [Tsukamurella tyrosinosolvens]MCA4997739.1 helix-turn-helix domain-containing protein [Tsukamurella tyrosinosolvens]
MPERLDAIVLTDSEIRYLLDVLAETQTALQRHGVRRSPRADAFIDRLRRVATPQTRQEHSAETTDHAPGSANGDSRRYDLLTPAEAGRILGLSSDGVRARIRRGRLPAYRAGGRWLVLAADVVAEAERRAA